MAKVFVVQEPDGKNILGAAEYGNIEILLPAGKQVTFSVGPTLFDLKQKLSHFSNDDYLLFIGDPVAIALAATIASEVNKGCYKCLKWDKQERRYFPIEVNLYPNRQ